jgi:serine/threonine-protein kinase
MIRSPLPCDQDLLRLLLEDRLPAEQESRLVHHLDDCTVCQRTLEVLAADQPWWDELRALEAAREGGGGPGAANLLGFLAPAEDPAHLGRLGPFAVTEVLGRGGTGIVFKALDGALDRPVAIKVLAPHFASSAAARKRFAREARAAAAVAHEHVIAIHSVDSWNGLPYLVMSYVDGRSLQERLEATGPLPVEEVVRVGVQAARGLAAAHAQGLVHRDVKPANILLELRNADCGLRNEQHPSPAPRAGGDSSSFRNPQSAIPIVKLTDFGLARAADDASLTQSGVIAGTPPYMSPEQARGEAVDHRSDLFSLGSTLYALCTGQAPFRAESALAVLRRVCEEQPTPVREVNPAVPEWLAAVIDRLHAKDPAGRFSGAAEVADLLEQCLAHLRQPDAVPLPPALAGTSAPPGRQGVGWKIAAGIALLFGAAAAVLHGTPLGDYLAGGRPGGEPGPAAAAPARGEEDSFERRLEEARRWTQALEADLRQPAAAGFDDPGETMLQDARRRLDALQRGLGTGE